nr:bifunctional transcriptional activator/DNA repair protein Ada [Lysobacter enzymogenes]
MNAKTPTRKSGPGAADQVAAGASSNAVAGDKLERARQLLDGGELSLTELSAAVGLSPSHLQRRFSARFGLSPAEYLAQRKLGSLRNALREGNDVSAALYDAGYGSPSRVRGRRRAPGHDPGALPRRRRRRADPLERDPHRARPGAGGDDRARHLHGRARRRRGGAGSAAARGVPRAALERVDAGRDEFLAPRVQAVADTLGGGAGEVPVDLIGTAFQKKVWDALMKIPPGQTRSYEEVARQIGSPRGARAVAQACASNKVAVVVPCHRVVRGDGSLGGYRWGLPLKQTLLQRERAA